MWLEDRACLWVGCAGEGKKSKVTSGFFAWASLAIMMPFMEMRFTREEIGWEVRKLIMEFQISY